MRTLSHTLDCGSCLSVLTYQKDPACGKQASRRTRFSWCAVFLCWREFLMWGNSQPCNANPCMTILHDKERQGCCQHIFQHANLLFLTHTERNTFCIFGKWLCVTWLVGWPRCLTKQGFSCEASEVLHIRTVCPNWWLLFHPRWWDFLPRPCLDIAMIWSSWREDLDIHPLLQFGSTSEVATKPVCLHHGQKCRSEVGHLWSCWSRKVRYVHLLYVVLLCIACCCFKKCCVASNWSCVEEQPNWQKSSIKCVCVCI